MNFDFIAFHISLIFNTQFGTNYKSLFLKLNSEDKFLTLKKSLKKNFNKLIELFVYAKNKE